MESQQIKNKLLLFTISFFYVILESNCVRPGEDGEEEIKRLQDEKKRKKNELTDRKGEIEIFNVFFTVCIGINSFLLLLILSCAIYEIISFCLDRKKKLKRKELIVKNIQQPKNYKNFSLKLSNGSSSSTDDEKIIPKVENSFHSSNISASLRSKKEITNYSNNVEVEIEKPNIKESNPSRPRLNSGNEAPIVNNIIKNSESDCNINDNKEQKLLTNDGNVDNDDDLNNPFEN